MPKGFYVKVSPSENFRAITNFFVKVTPSSWSSVVDGWVKVSPSSWVPFYSAATEPANPIEILTTFNSSEEIRLQGKNYRWSPSPTTLQYRFKVINKESPSSTYDLTSLTTTSNPSAGSSITVPSSSTYIDVPKSGGNYFQGATNVFQFFVRATTATGSVVEKSAEYEFRIPAAPILAIESLTSSSVRLTITAASSADFNATYRYIVYRYDSTAGFVYAVTGGTNGLGAVSATTYSTTRDVTGLVPGRAYTFYVLPITGSTGITPNTHAGYPGVVASINNSVVPADPGPFTTISFTKGFPSSSSQGVVRTSSLSWNASENATRYEIQYQGRNFSTDAWTTVQSFASSPYETSTSQSKQWGSPVPSGGVQYYTLMRASIRATNPDSTVDTYSDGGTASAPFYIEAAGAAPSSPSFGTISAASSTASIPVTISTNTGSNFLNSSLEFMFRKSDQSYPSTWSSTTISNNSATISLSSLESNSTYYIKVRVQNFDFLTAENETFFNTTQPAKLSTPQNVSASDNLSTGIQVSWTNVSNASTYGVWYGGQPSYDSTPDFGGPTNRGGKTITSTPFLDDAVSTGTTRDYYVQAFPSSTQFLKSDWSLGDFGTRVSAATVPTAPTNLFTSNITSSGATINWSAPTSNGGATITNYEVNRDGGGFFSVGNVTSYNYFISVAGTYTIGVRAVNSAGAGPAATISVTIPAAFVPPTCAAPSWGASFFQRTSSIIRWYCDYPTPSGNWSSITGMQFQIRSTAGGGTLFADTTRAFPGFGTYPYAGGGTVWAFRCGTSDGDISFTTSARFARARVVMVGTNGTTYFGTWTDWY